MGYVGLRRLLVGVGTISQGHSLHITSKLVRREFGTSILVSEVSADSIIILGGHLECLQCELAAEGLIHISLAVGEGGKEFPVIGRVREDRNTGVILGRGTQKGDSSDVNFLDGISKRAVCFRDSFRKGVEVADDNGDGRNSLRFQVFLVGLDAPGKNTYEL